MAKLTLSDLTSLANDTSAVNTINSNNALIEAAMDSAVFRSGATPNAMAADLDLGTNYLLNVKSPNNGTDGASKAYVDSLLSGTTDTGSAQLRVDIASTASTEGASLVGVEDSAAKFTGTNVETVLAELDTNHDTLITDLASTANTKGASTIGIEDAVSAFTGTEVEAVTNEIFDKARYMQYAYLVASGTDTYTATPSPVLSAYTTGETYRVSFANANTSVAPTLNINSLGAKTVKIQNGSALVAGNIEGEHLLTYDGTDMILLNPVDVDVGPAISTGTWTPTIQDNTQSDAEGQTYNSQVGFYTKIGDSVFFKGFLDISSLGTLTTSEEAKIAGLPFTSSATSGSHSTINIGNGSNLSITATESLTGTLPPSSSRITINTWSQATGIANTLLSEITASGTLVFSGFYSV